MENNVPLKNLPTTWGLRPTPNATGATVPNL